MIQATMMSIELDGSALKSSVAFTGRLACMSRAEAFDVVRRRGGTPSPEVTKYTQVLVVGELGWPLLDDGRPSNKLSLATTLGIPIVSERRFLQWIGKSASASDQKTYTADQMASLTKMSIGMIRGLAQLSLLDERDGRFGFRDLASARRISKLLNDGVRLSEIIRAVSEIRKCFLTLVCRPCVFMQVPSTTFWSSSMAGARTNMVSSSSPSMTRGRTPMSYSIGRILPSKLGTLPRPNGSIELS